MKEALLVLVHGSPRPVANNDVYAVVDVVRQQEQFAIVEVGFIDCNLPTIPQAIEICVARGAERVIAVPYFLHTGNHVINDLPAMLEAAQARHPGIEFLMGDILGNDALLAEVIHERITDARG